MSRSLVRRRLLIGVALFVLFSLPVAVLQPIFVQDGQSSVAEAKTIKKKKKKVKKVKKTVNKTVKTNSEVNQDPNTYKNANYKGPFPAPEGMVLEGTSGEDQFKDPTGDGKYRFRIQTAWKNPLACLDKTRTVVGSKGKTWEEGWYKGYSVGEAEGNRLIAVYDETPQGSNAGKALFDEGYRLGYNRGFAGGSFWGAQYPCSGHDVDLSHYDDDGWYKMTLEKVPELKALYLPLGGAISTGNSLLGTNGTYVSLDNDAVHQDPFSKSTPAINLTRADFLVSDLDASEQAMSMQDLVQASYDIMKKEIDKKYHAECVVDAPLIQDATYGNNTFTNLNFVVMCSSTTVQLDGSKKVDGKWMLSVYSFKKLAKDKMLLIQLFSPLSVKAKDKAELDTSKFPNADFISQFYSKMQF